MDRTQNRRLMSGFWRLVISVMPKSVIYWAVVYAWGYATTGKYKETLAGKLTVITMLERFDAEFGPFTDIPATPPKRRRKTAAERLESVVIDGEPSAYAYTPEFEDEVVSADEATEPVEDAPRPNVLPPGLM